jgi:PAT family beta-lactamase induction signal transducer AmpG
MCSGPVLVRTGPIGRVIAVFRLPNLLSTRWGRLVAFFLLYLTEGIPLGFTAVALATQMRREGVPPDQIGIFVGLLYVPWAWKWVLGPFVDLVYSERLGRRRGWIMIAQTVMALGLLAGMGIDYSQELRLLTIVVFVVNIFAATQDVAIDALACGVLKENERGLANGLMFAGAYTGQAVGGAGVLFLAEYLGDFRRTFVFVTASILVVTVLVVLPLREPKHERPKERDADWFRVFVGEVATYLRVAFRSFFGSRRSLCALGYALLPCGPQALGLALATTLQVEIGMTDGDIARLALVTALVSAFGCVLGGFLSDKLGRRRMLAIYVVLMAVPTLLLAYVMQRDGWIMPIEDLQAPDRVLASAEFMLVYWAISIMFALFTGLMYGTRTALFMDVCNPEVAATQFTAYMAVLNLVIAYSAFWQGQMIVRLGYPATLTVDAIAGLLSIALLPWITKRSADG